MQRSAAARIGAFLSIGIAFSLTACSSGGTSGSSAALNLAGSWTATLTSTQGNGSVSGTATVSQSGSGLGVNGTTDLSVPGGAVAVTQNGTALAGSISNSKQSTSYDFTGTLSSGNLTLTGSYPCDALHGSGTQTTTITAVVASSSIHGTYTVARPSPCAGSGDAGNFTATKQ